MTYEELSALVIKWGEDRNIVSPAFGQVYAQLNKVHEELTEVERAVRALEEVKDYGDSMAASSLKHRYRDELKLEVGDLMVTVIISAACIGIDPLVALEAAYEKIKNRTGRTVNGQFVKDTIQ